MKLFRLKIPGLVILIIMAVLFSFQPAFARRAKDAGYPLEMIEISDGVVNRVAVNPDYNFAFPVTVSNEHVAAYIWIKKMIEAGKLPQGLAMVYLDTHHNYPVGDKEFTNSQNWVRSLIENNLISEAILILPVWLNGPYALQIADNVDKLQRIYGRRLSLVADLERLPDGEVLGPVFLSIDCDYFSNKGYPQHIASGEEIRDEIQRIIGILRAKNIKIAALNISLSAGYTTAGREAIIKEEILKAFAGYGK